MENGALYFVEKTLPYQTFNTVNKRVILVKNGM